MFEPKLSTEVDLLEIRLSCEKELAKHGGDYAVGAEMKRKEDNGFLQGRLVVAKNV